MNRIIFSIMLFLASGYMQATPIQTREHLKNAFFKDQKGLLDRKAYDIFFEPYLCRAEATLPTLAFCMQNPNLELVEYYLEFLMSFNAAMFNKYVRSSFRISELYSMRYETLREIITEIKNKYNLSHIQVEKEMRETAQLFYEANKAFYSQLSFKKKISIQYYSIMIGLK